jgi:hypothetical protein
MLKFGIWDAASLIRAARAGALSQRRFLAATLYPAIARTDDPERERLLELILARFPTRNASLKRTESRRFHAFDRDVARVLAERFGDVEGVLEIHDVAVSDGRTSVDFFQLLESTCGLRSFHLTASDYAPDVLAVDAGGPLTVVLDPRTEDLIQVIRPPFVFNVPEGESPWHYPVNRLVLRFLRFRDVPRLVARWKAGDPDVRTQHIWLLHPRCAALAESDPRFAFERYDLLSSPARKSHVVRAMNVLNPSYFSEEDLARMLQHVFEGLVEGGLFVTGSNQGADSVVDGAVYERTERGFRRILASGSGSPVDRIATSRVPGSRASAAGLG